MARKAASNPTDDELLDAAIAESNAARVKLGSEAEPPRNQTSKQKRAALQINTALERAVMESDAPTVEIMLARGGDPNMRHSRRTGLTFASGFAILQYPLMAGKVEVATLLLNARASLHVGTSEPPYVRPQLSWLVEFGLEFRIDDDWTPETVELLLEGKADPNEEWHSTAPLFQLLMIKEKPLTRVRIARVLLEHGADPNRGCLGQFPLVAASCGGPAGEKAPLALVAMLLDARAHIDAHLPWDGVPNEKCATTATALWASSHSGRADIVQLLLDRRASCDIPVLTGVLPIHIAAEKDHAGVVALLLNAGCDTCSASISHGSKPHTPLQNAAANNSPKVVQLLLDRGVPPDGVGLPKKEAGAGQAPLTLACQYGNTECARLLIEGGAQLHQLAPLSTACACGCFGLAAHGAQTPLTVACNRGHDSTVALLVRLGAVEQSRPSARRAVRAAQEAGHTACARTVKAQLYRCALCGEHAAKSLRCQSCRETFYCCAEHQAEHWQTQHHTECADVKAATESDTWTESLHGMRILRKSLGDGGKHIDVLRGAITSVLCLDDEREAEDCEQCAPASIPAPEATSNAVDYIGATPEQPELSECVICLEDVAIADDQEALPCAHVFHGACIRDWLSRDFTYMCPMRCEI